MGLSYSSPFQVTPALETLKHPPKGEPCALLVIGVCESWSEARFAKFLQRYNIQFQKVQKIRGQNYAILNFADNNDRITAYSFLHDCKISNNTFQVKPYVEYDPPPVPFATQSEIMKGSSLKTQTVIERKYLFLNKPAAERLERKKTETESFLKEVYTNPFEIVESPIDYSGHSRVDLLAGYDLDGNICVGFNSSSRVNCTITQIDESFKVPEQVINIARIFRDYISKSIFPPYDVDLRTGKWMKLSIRVSSTAGVLITIATNGGLPLDEVDKLKATLSPHANSIYWLKCDDNQASYSSPHHTISGAQFITEKVGGLTFPVYPFTVMPTNFYIFDKVIETVKTMASLNENTVLVDLCCGTGVNILNLAKFVKRAIGIDSNDSNVATSTHNAEDNAIKNAYFVLGGQSTLGDIANNVTSAENLVGILDTSQIGPHTEILKNASATHKLRKLIYITKSPSTLRYDIFRNFPDMKIMDVKLFDIDPLTIESQLVALLIRE